MALASVVNAVTSDNSQKLDIGTQKNCDCPPNHLNCLTAKEWLKAQLGEE